MPDVYEQHRKSFQNVAAYVVLNDETDSKGNPQRAATVAFKYGARCTCYFHVIGAQMAKGWADGGGYDKASAAAHHAISRIERNAWPEHVALIERISAAVKDQGRSWEGDLRAAGFEVWQAV